MTKFNFYGKAYYLMYTGNAFFELLDEFGEPSDIVTKILPNTREAFEITCKVAAVLSEQGSLVRAYMGHEKTDILSAEAFLATARPINLIALKRAVSNEIFSGANREENEEEEIDLGLLELQKKTEKS